MTLDFFQLKEEPFAAPPNPRFLYLSATHREALASLLRTLQADRGLVTLVAQPGLGKTTLLFHILNTLGGKVATVYILQAAQTPADLLQAILSDLGVRHVGKNLEEMVSQLKGLATEEQRLGRRVVVVIDDAQNLDTAAFHLFSKVSGFGRGRLVQFVLCGQPMLADKLASIKPWRELQREAPIVRLEPLSENEIALYLDHRLRTAGHARQTPLFTFEASSLVARYSQGNPRIMNRLCNEALATAGMDKREQIGAKTVQEAAATLKLTTPQQENRSSKPAQASSAPRVFSQAEPLRQGSAFDGTPRTQLSGELQASQVESVVSSPLSFRPEPQAPEAVLEQPIVAQLETPSINNEQGAAVSVEQLVVVSIETETAQVLTRVPDVLQRTVLSANPELPGPTETQGGDNPQAMAPVFVSTRQPLMPAKREFDLSRSPTAPTGPQTGLHAVVSPLPASAKAASVKPEDLWEKSVEAQAPAYESATEKAGIEGEMLPPKIRQTPVRRAPAPPTLVSDEKSIALSHWHRALRKRKTSAPRARGKKRAPAPTRLVPQNTTPGSTPWWLVPPPPTAGQPVASAPLPSPFISASSVQAARIASQEPVPSLPKMTQGDFRPRWFPQSASRGSGGNGWIDLRALGSRPFVGSGIAALLVIAASGVVFSMAPSKLDRSSGQVVAPSSLQPPATGIQPDLAIDKARTNAGPPKAKPGAIPLSANAAEQLSSTKDLKGMNLESALQALSTQKVREQQEEMQKARANK